MKHKVVYNTCFGLACLSDKALDLYRKYANDYTTGDADIRYLYIPRHDKNLVAVVEKLGKKANGNFSELSIIEIDSDKYFIDNYDGFESVHTPKSTDWVYF